MEALRLMLPAQMRGERVRVKTAQWAHLTAQGEALEQALAAARRAPRRAEILRRLAQGDQPAAQMRALGAGALQTLCRRAWSRSMRGKPCAARRRRASRPRRKRR